MTQQGSATDAVTGAAGPRRRRPTWLRVVSGGLVGLLVVVAGILAARADGEPVHDVALTDGRVWVSGGRTASWGRVNPGAHALDLVLEGAGKSGQEEGVHRPDVLQDGRNAAGITADWRLVAIDTRTGEVIDGEAQIPRPEKPTGEEYLLPDVAAMNGDTVAVVNHESGQVWAQRLDPEGGTSIDGLTGAAPLDTIGAFASVTVDEGGDVMAVSAETGRVVEIPAEGDGFGAPRRHDTDFSGRAADITAVGDRWVVLDLEKGEVHAEGLSEPQPLPGDGPDTKGVALRTATLQQPGPASEVVAVQTLGEAGFVRIEDGADHESEAGVTSGLDPDSGRVEYSKISPPVVSGDCLYAAWGRGHAIHWGRACDDESATADQIRHQGDVERRTGVAVRYNRGRVVLNDLDTGRVYDLSLPGELRIDTWPGGAPRAPASSGPSSSTPPPTTSTG